MRDPWQSIPTEYNGTVYASRLEADFAQWLTENGIGFEYEREVTAGYGFTHYPDFYLYAYDVYAETKPRCFVREIDRHAPTILKSEIRLLVVDHYGPRGGFDAWANFNLCAAGERAEGPGPMSILRDQPGVGGPCLRVGNLVLAPLVSSEAAEPAPLEPIVLPPAWDAAPPPKRRSRLMSFL